MYEQEVPSECRSCHAPDTPKPHQAELTSMSDLNFFHSQSPNLIHRITYFNSNEEYSKTHELDQIPVKESASHDITPISTDSLCDSDIDRLEKRIYKNVSQELQTDESSFSSLDANIKFFKSTVEKIFENFYSSLSDFEQYKKRFNQIIARSKEGSIDDMEDFIKDMFENILSGESSLHTAFRRNSLDKTNIGTSSGGDTASLSIEPECKTCEEDKSSNLTYSIEEPSAPNSCNMDTLDEICNIFLISGRHRSVEIKLKARNILSEIQMKSQNNRVTDATVSADDLRRLAAKKLEVERYIEQPTDNLPDRNIPVKISFPKKDIHLNEDFNARMGDNCETGKSFIGKLCSMICKKLRKNAIG